MVREFLSRNRISFVPRDVFSDPGAKAEWQDLNLGIVPCVALGDRHRSILHVSQLREFLELSPGDDAVPYQDLVGAMNRVLEAVERAVLQVPTERLSDPTPNRGRDLRELVFNIHERIPPMQEGLDTGRYDWAQGDDYGRSRSFRTTADLAECCRQVRARWLERARGVSPDEADGPIETHRGVVTHHQLLESQAHHAAQHLRQIYVFLRGLGVEPAGELSAEAMLPIVLGDEVF